MPAAAQTSSNGDRRHDQDRDEPGSPLQPVLALVALLRRRIWLVLPVIVATLGVAWYKMRTDPPSYRATAVIRVFSDRRPLSEELSGDGERKATAPPSPSIDPALSLIQLLRSRTVAREVVEKEGLRVQILPNHFPTNLVNPRALPPAALRAVQVDSSAASDTFRLRLRFWKHGVTARGASSDARAAYGVPLELGGVRFTVDSYPGVESADLAVVPLNQAVGDLLKELRAEPREKTDVIDVTYMSTDPGVAQRVVNTAAQVFQAVNARTAQQRAVQRRRFIESQLESTDSFQSEADLALSAFRSREHPYNSRDRLVARQDGLTDLEVRRGDLAADRRVYQNLLTSLARPARGGESGEQLSALVAAPEVAANPVVSQLYGQLARYQAARDSLTTGTGGIPTNHPDVKRLDTLAASTVGKIATAVRGQLAAIDARLGALDELTSRSAAKMSGLPAIQDKEQRLLQRAETYRRTADLLRKKLHEAQIEEASEVGQVEVMDLADLPTIPIRGSRAVKLMFGLVLGLLLGGGSAYLFENRKPVFRGQAEVETALRIPNLAVIPRLKLPKGNGRRSPGSQKNGERTAQSQEVLQEVMPELEASPALVTLSDMCSNGAEAYRMLRTNLFFSESVQALTKLVVTSAAPQEGKTTIATNLAVTCAQQGFRVLLVDCDLRSPQIHKLFRLPLEPGLMQLLGSNVDMEVIRSTPVERLSVLPAGSRSQNPSELVGSLRLRSVLDELSGMFDLIIFDTPPVLLASEAAILSKQVDGVLVVVRAGRTERELARRAVHQLTVVGARVVGTVLNDPDAEEAKYGASYGYYNHDA